MQSEYTELKKPPKKEFNIFKRLNRHKQTNIKGQWTSK
jgi:hypothetical protein